MDEPQEKQLSLMSLAWPLFIEQGLRMLIGTVDIFMVSHVSDGAVAAVSVANMVLVFFLVAFNFIGIGTSVVITHHLGAKDRPGADQIATTAIAVNTWLGVIFSVVVYLLAAPMLRVIFLPVPQLAGAAVSIAAFTALYFFINRTDFGRALEATREDAGAVALVGIDKNRVFALGWGLGAALVGLAGAIMAMFFYIYPDVGASFALIAYVTVALGGFGSVFGAFAGGIVVGLVEATTALILPPSLKSVGIYAVYLLVVFIRPRGLFGSL